MPNNLTGKPSVFILNCCVLGDSEVEFWNSLFARYQHLYKFHFFTTVKHTALNADEIIEVAYEATIFEQVPTGLTQHFKSIIESVAQKDLIWEVFDETRSHILAYSWLKFWTLALRIFTPVHVIIWNGHHVPEAALDEACKLEGVPRVFAERGPFAGTFALDQRGVNCLSTFFTEYQAIDDPPKERSLHAFTAAYLSAGVSNWGQPVRKTPEGFKRAIGIPKGKKVLFFPSQVDQDTNSKLFSPHFRSTHDALTAVIEWCNAHCNEVFLLIKKHPMQESQQQLPKIELKSGAFVENVHIFDCIQNVDGIVSINTSSALEGALFGKPVLLLGDSLLNHWSPVQKLTSRADLPSALRVFVNSIHSGKTFEPGEFFNKLVFKYLCTTKAEYTKLGVPLPAIDPGPKFRLKSLGSSQDLLGQTLSSLELLVPTPNSAMIELRHHKILANERLLQLEFYQNNLLLKILRKLQILRVPKV